MELTWNDFLQFVAALMTLIVSMGGATGITNLIKDRFNLEGQQAQMMAWLVAGSIAILAAMLNGIITPELFTNPFVAAATILLVITGNHQLYHVQKAKEAKAKAAELEAQQPKAIAKELGTVFEDVQLKILTQLLTETQSKQLAVNQ